MKKTIIIAFVAILLVAPVSYTHAQTADEQHRALLQQMIVLLTQQLNVLMERLEKVEREDRQEYFNEKYKEQECSKLWRRVENIKQEKTVYDSETLQLRSEIEKNPEGLFGGGLADRLRKFDADRRDGENELYTRISAAQKEYYEINECKQ